MAAITVIGTGYVGLVSGACLADFGNTVVCVDTNREKIDALKGGKIPIYEPGLESVVAKNSAEGRLSFSTELPEALSLSEVVFIAVGTPPQDDGSADLSFVEQVARSLGKLINKYTVVVDKSTVPVGTARKVRSWIEEELNKRAVNVPFDVVSNPEFLREGSAVFDFTHPDRVVIGSDSERARNIMKEVYRSLYLSEAPYIETNPESAEMIKYASNAFLAVKITFINEIANLCEKVGAHVQDVSRAMGKDGRIGSKFLHPGPGYGGSCFPKDTKALSRIGLDAGERQQVVETAIAVNERQKIRMVDKIEVGFSGLGGLPGKTVALLGLAFKPNTDDMRESPAITICQELVKRGARIRCYDPAAMKEARWRLDSLGNSITFSSSEYDCASGADALVIVTEWNQFRNLDLGKIKKSLKSPLFFDLRNIYKREEAEEAGLRYTGVGV